tara:strand:+ start:4203 stop:4667 length:465 start_codon:yes stop_codon:yes gene_type:complete
MEQNKFNRDFLLLTAFFLITGCQYQWVEKNYIELQKIEYGSSIEDSFKNKTLKYFSTGSSKNNLNLKILNVKFKKKNFYGGPAARAKQIEIFGELEYIFFNSVVNKNGKLKTSGLIPVNEANPLSEMNAQREIIKELETLLLKKLMQEYWLIES